VSTAPAPGSYPDGPRAPVTPPAPLMQAPAISPRALVVLVLGALLLLALHARPARGQDAAHPPAVDAATLAAYRDTVVAWPHYAGDRRARVRLFRNGNARDAGARPYVLVLDEPAALATPAAGEAAYVAEHLGRAMGVSPERLVVVFRFTAGSFVEGAGERKPLHLRATFRRLDSGRLGAPLWRLLSAEEVAALTGRTAP